MNKVISREYIEKNYIHKDKIREIFEEELGIIKNENEIFYARENVIEIILKGILKNILEGTEDDNRNTNNAKVKKKQSKNSST